MTSHADPSHRWQALYFCLLLTGAAFLLVTGLVLSGVSHPFDVAVSRSVQSWRTEPLDALMLVVTLMCDGLVNTVVSVACVGWLLWRRYWRLAGGVALLMLLVAGGIPALKMLMAIPRPVSYYTGRQAFSFPSGHATSAAALWGTLAWLVSSAVPARKRVMVLTAAAALIASIAISRVYLAAHWPSDVLGGVLLGLSLASALALRQQHLDKSRPQPLRLGLVAMLVWLCFGAWHVISSYSTAVAFYGIETSTSADCRSQSCI